MAKDLQIGERVVVKKNGVRFRTGTVGQIWKDGTINVFYDEASKKASGGSHAGTFPYEQIRKLKPKRVAREYWIFEGVTLCVASRHPPEKEDGTWFKVREVLPGKERE